MEATMNTVMMNDVQMTAKEVGTVSRGLKARIAAAVKILFEGNEEKPYGLDLTPAMKARLYL